MDVFADEVWDATKNPLPLILLMPRNTDSPDTRFIAEKVVFDSCSRMCQKDFLLSFYANR